MISRIKLWFKRRKCRKNGHIGGPLGACSRCGVVTDLQVAQWYINEAWSQILNDRIVP